MANQYPEKSTINRTRAKQLTEETGVPHEVDHTIPISKGGLHHQDNLQVLTREENRRKSNIL